MQILITGGAGYIGSHTAKRLAQAGYEPVVLDNLRHGHRWAVRWGPLVEMHLSDREGLAQVFQNYRIPRLFTSRHSRMWVSRCEIWPHTFATTW